MNKYADVIKESKSIMRPKSQQRQDTTLAMKRITTMGWEYSEDIAKSNNIGDGYYIADTKKVMITPEDAADLYNNHSYEYNRNFDSQHAAHLASVIEHVVNIAIAIGPNGSPRLVNGNHNMWAIVLKGTAVQAAVVIYQCRDEKAMARLYACFDSNKVRSEQVILQSAQLAGDLDSEISIPKLTKCSKFVSSAENDYNRCIRKEANTEKLYRAKRSDVMAFAKWFEEVTRDKVIHKLMPQGIGSAIYAMWLSDFPRADSFVRQYVDGTNLSKNSPILRLREAMLHRGKEEHGASVCRKHTEMAYSCWKKFCLGEDMIVVRRTSDIPAPDGWKIAIPPPHSMISNPDIVVEDNVFDEANYTMSKPKKSQKPITISEKENKCLERLAKKHQNTGGSGLLHPNNEQMDKIIELFDVLADEAMDEDKKTKKKRK